MSFPGFAAESALYETSGRYQMAAGFAGLTGVAPQAPLLRHCGPCYWSDGQCVQDCTTCIPCPPGHLPNGCGGCDTETVPCKSGHCTAPPPCCPKGCQGQCP